jgi:hypothetical protein
VGFLRTYTPAFPQNLPLTHLLRRVLRRGSNHAPSEKWEGPPSMSSFAASSLAFGTKIALALCVACNRPLSIQAMCLNHSPDADVLFVHLISIPQVQRRWPRPYYGVILPPLHGVWGTGSTAPQLSACLNRKFS